MFERNALEVYNEEIERTSIVTLCRELDEAIDDGIPLGKITEFTGAPGSGKTQICLQLCVNVQIPKNLFGLEGAAVFIDTNRGFTINRLKEMATACYKHCDYIYKAHNIIRSDNIFTVDSIMDNVYCNFCNNYLELLAAIAKLRDLLSTDSKIRLIVIDSFSNFFRHSIEESLDRTRLLYQTLVDLEEMAKEFDCAIVLTNELTTRIENDEAYVVPALGDSHLHRVNYHITVGRDLNDSELFVAEIKKTFCNPEKLVPFRITKDGIKARKKKKETVCSASR